MRPLPSTCSYSTAECLSQSRSILCLGYHIEHIERCCIQWRILSIPSFNSCVALSGLPYVALCSVFLRLFAEVGECSCIFLADFPLKKKKGLHSARPKGLVCESPFPPRLTPNCDIVFLRQEEQNSLCTDHPGTISPLLCDSLLSSEPKNT